MVGAAIYLLLSFLAIIVVKATTLLYFTDYWEHRAIVGEVIRHGTTLTDPIYGENATSRQFTPWSLALGLLGRWTGMNVDHALETGAMLVAVLFVYGTWDFARNYFRDRWAPALFLAVLCCGWGFLPLIWTGFYSLRSQFHSDYYPASVVFALTLVCWAQVIRLLRSPRLRPELLLATTAIVAFSFITQPLNALPLIGGGIGLAILDPGIARPRRAAVIIAIAVGAVITILWPYFDPFELGGPGLARGKETFNNFGFFFSPLFIIAEGWPALLSVLFIKGQSDRPEYRIGILALLLTSLAFMIGMTTGISVTHRLLAYVFLAGHLILTRGLLDLIAGRPDTLSVTVSPATLRKAGTFGLCYVAWQVLLGVGQLIWPWSLSNYPYPLADVAGETARVSDFLPRDAYPIGYSSAALVLPTFGFHVAVFPRPMPFSPSDDARQADYQRFFEKRGVSLAERQAIIRRWGATHIVYLANETTPRQQRDLLQFGPARSPAGYWRVIALDGAKPFRRAAPLQGPRDVAAVDLTAQ